MEIAVNPKYRFWLEIANIIKRENEIEDKLMAQIEYAYQESKTIRFTYINSLTENRFKAITDTQPSRYKPRVPPCAIPITGLPPIKKYNIDIKLNTKNNNYHDKVARLIKYSKQAIRNRQQHVDEPPMN